MTWECRAIQPTSRIQSPVQLNFAYFEYPRKTYEDRTLYIPPGTRFTGLPLHPNTTAAMSEREAPPPRRLLKQQTWSPNMYREETWVRRQGNSNRRRRDRCKSVTDDDLDELRGCIDLGFGFHPEPNELDPKLAQTFPALELFCAVNKQYNECLSSMFDLGEDPETVKAKLKQWAQVVACSVRQSSPIP
ncbi:PREDICTED: uncharacterized protein LOC109165392 [Ipomoea nil]|uniref:uncharacterized protein LOC109165392 n=1 Tax=Ipomoea nil TaxID=35883 RepID=UPI000900A1F4|nr:PREDICTED: uncharacterized protein LOC109165392 [Ipomoea nil]